MSETTLRARSAIDSAWLWNAESVYGTRAAWYSEAEEVEKLIAKLAGYAGTVSPAGGGTPARLVELFDFSDKVYLTVSRLYFYATMSSAVDKGDSEAQAMQSQVGGLYGKTMAAASFIEPEILAIGRETLHSWIEADKRLAIRSHYFENLFRTQAHVRSPEIEEVLGLVTEVFQSADNIHDMIVDSDLKFSPAKAGKTVAQSTIDKLMNDPDREVRKSAWENYCDSYLAFKNSLASSLTTAVKKDAFNAKVRKFDSSLEAALFHDNIPQSVYDKTIETFKKHLPVWHRYWKVKRKALGLDTLHHYDIWAPIAKKQPVVPYAQAVQWIRSAMEPLGKDYVETLRRGCLDERWVDVYPTEGKSSGAFSFGSKTTHPFIMMSYSDDLSSLSTLTHELGHSMHSWHTWKNQPPVYSDYSIFVAEVASNFNQALTRAYLFDTQKDPQFQIAVIEEAMENFHRYFFIMPTLARFELEFHKRVESGKGVTAEDLNALMVELFSEGYGGELVIDPEREGITWAQFSHLYMNFYVFQYATGISAAHALAAPILAGNQDSAKRYIEFLSCGSSRYPVDALKLAGVDMTTSAAMEKGFEVVSSLVDKLEKLTK